MMGLASAGEGKKQSLLRKGKKYSGPQKKLTTKTICRGEKEKGREDSTNCQRRKTGVKLRRRIGVRGKKSLRKSLRRKRETDSMPIRKKKREGGGLEKVSLEKKKKG